MKLEQEIIQPICKEEKEEEEEDKNLYYITFLISIR
jgi:hypothetical protein